MARGGCGVKKLILCSIFLIVFCLYGCSSEVQASSVVSQQEDTTQYSLSGTYIGKNGSVLTLFPDNTSEYYYMTSNVIDQNAGTWDYKNNQLVWQYAQNELIASVENEGALSFIIETEELWTREEFIKISNDSESKSVEQCRQLLRDALGGTEINNFEKELNKVLTVGQIQVQIPFYWVQTESNFYVAENFEEEDCFAYLLVINYPNMEVSDSDFESLSSDIWYTIIDQLEEQGMTCEMRKTPYIISANQHIGVEGYFDVKDSNQVEFNTKATFINDSRSNNIICFVLWQTDNTIFKYDSDYDKMIQSISSVNESVTLDTEDGVDPKLKRLLDDYEMFVDEYLAFMQEYMGAEDTQTVTVEYLYMMQKYAEFTDKLNAYESSEMSTRDALYYAEVMSRVSEKFLKASENT